MPITHTRDTVELSLGEFSSASVALKGATVFSYVQSGCERLFTSSTSNVSLSDPAAVRGGVPICFPVFGPPPKDNPVYNQLKQHGFARTAEWRFLEDQSTCDGPNGVRALFELTPTPAIEAVFALAFHLVYTVELTPNGLSLSLSVTSPADAVAPLPFQALLHSYFRLPAAVRPRDTRVTPLEHVSFSDKVQGGATDVERRPVVVVDGPKGEVDRVYLRAPDKLRVAYDPATGATGSIELRKKNLADVVLWNPGPEKAATIKDLEPDGADRYVCLEPGQTSSWVSLDPGESWNGSIDVAFNDSE
ncbi:hypothetical protein JCM11491_005595 [Sporobolomyces phaffii]